MKQILKQHLIALVGLLLLLPSLIIAFAIISHKLGFTGMLNFVDFRYFFFHPIARMMSLTFAFLLNLVAATEPKRGQIFKIRKNASMHNLNIVFICVILAALQLIMLVF